MPKLRFILLCVVSMTAIGAVASTSASAAAQSYWACQNVGLHKGHWKNAHCSERGGNEEWDTVAITETRFEGTSGTSKLESGIAGEKLSIECLKSTTKGTLKTAGTSEGEVRFKECKIFNGHHELLVNCKAKEPIEFKFTDQLIQNALGEVEDEFKPTQPEETFVELTIEGLLCAVKFTNLKVKGTQTCELPSAELALQTHTIVCTSAGSKLKLGKEEATFTSTQKVNLASGLLWGAV
jgi:hypothetical protein